MIKPLLTLLAFFGYMHLSAQTAAISGEVKDDNTGSPVSNAVIALFNLADSILLDFTRTNSSGHYEIKGMSPGKYLLMASHPLYADIYFDVTISGNTAGPSVALISKATLLKEVIVKTGAPFRVKGDTTVYTADSFQVSANANVEELLKKLPGIQVDHDGNIKAMGETVQKVLVDGEEFFGNDPGMAVKNLRADAVKEVQVFDKKSDQAEFTGIDDGKSAKTINLKLKDNKKHGYFGKIDIGGGPQKDIDPRYNANLLFGSFKGKRKLSAFLLNGNTGQDGLSWEDEQKYGSDYTPEVTDDGSIYFIGSGSDGEAYINTENGFITNLNAGMQYSNKWQEKYNLNISPKYNEQHYDNRQQIFSRSQIGDSLLNSDNETISHVIRDNIKLRAVLDTKLDSFNTIKIISNSNFYHTRNFEDRISNTTGGSGSLKNTSTRSLNTDYEKAAISGSIAFRHKFKKDRRTFSITGNWSLLDNNGTNFLKSDNTIYTDGSPSDEQILNQKKDSRLETKNLSAQISYTEPLSKTLSLQFSYRMALNKGKNDQSTYNYIDPQKGYTEKVDSLSNDFRQQIVQNVPSITFNLSTKKIKLNAGSGFGFTHFDLRDVTFSKSYIRDYTNFYPNANATYTYKPNHTIRLYYNGYSRQPDVDQLQPLRNNNDYFYQRIGNPDLKPSFNHTFSLSHQNYNFVKGLWSYQSVYFNFQQNAFAMDKVVDLNTGKTISQAVNVDGNYYLSFYSGLSFKLPKPGLVFDFGPQLSLNQYAELINHIKSYSKTLTPGIRVRVNKAKEKKYDFTLGNEFEYNSNVTTQNDRKVDYYTNVVSANATVYHNKVWSIQSDFRYYYRQKSFAGDKDLSTSIWNARLQRTFKHDEFTAWLLVRDILNQNVGVDRYFSGNTYSETINDRLRRYFMVGFTWNFKNKGTK